MWIGRKVKLFSVPSFTNDQKKQSANFKDFSI